MVSAIKEFLIAKLEFMFEMRAGAESWRVWRRTRVKERDY